MKNVSKSKQCYYIYDTYSNSEAIKIYKYGKLDKKLVFSKNVVLQKVSLIILACQNIYEIGTFMII